MSLRKLSQFLYFDIDEFLQKKKLVTCGMSDWKDYDTQKVLGVKIDLVIVSDKTEYNCADGEMVSNVYEKLTVKIPAKLNNLPMNAEVKLVNPEAIVYGEYRNQLSITAENIEVVGK